METKIIKIDQDNLDHKLMQEAGDLIAAGELVAFPTETVYSSVSPPIRYMALAYLRTSGLYFSRI